MGTRKKELHVIIERTYRACDDAFQKVAGPKMTCTKGCSACCRQLTLIMPAEAMSIVHHVVSHGLLTLELIQALRNAAIAADYPGVDCANYFDQHLACPFLKDDLCTIYAKRPAVCRYYAVASPPSLCNETGSRVARIDGDPFLELVLDVEARVMREVPEFGVRVAPIPIMILWALNHAGRCTNESDPLFTALRKAIREVPSPDEWAEEHFDRVKAHAAREREMPVQEPDYTRPDLISGSE